MLSLLRWLPDVWWRVSIYRPLLLKSCDNDFHGIDAWICVLISAPLVSREDSAANDDALKKPKRKLRSRDTLSHENSMSMLTTFLLLTEHRPFVNNQTARWSWRRTTSLDRIDKIVLARAFSTKARKTLNNNHCAKFHPVIEPLNQKSRGSENRVAKIANTTKKGNAKKKRRKSKCT